MLKRASSYEQVTSGTIGRTSALGVHYAIVPLLATTFDRVTAIWSVLVTTPLSEREWVK